MIVRKVWDPLVRVFHWSLVAGFAANAMFTDPEEGLHHWIGYAVLALVGIRVVWGLVGSPYVRFSSFPPDPAGVVGQVADVATGRRRVHLGHTPMGALMIYNLLVTMVVIGVSGYMMTTFTWFGVEWVEELHEASVTWAEISVVVHVAAVVWESLRTGVNLPRAMVTGYKKVPDDSVIAGQK
jgi:cytochrome b